jgi:4-hydroxyphenylpyruvate dioxygenase
MRKSIATVSVSGTLTEKLDAVAAAGFDGVEIFENDLVACPLPPEEIRRRAAGLGLDILLYQPLRDFEAVPGEMLRANLRRAEHTFRLMGRLGADTLLVCSNVSPHAIPDDALAAEQLRLLAERAAEHGIRIAYEALAWGRHVNEYLHAWRIVRTADHPALGVCLDSFHILSRGSDPIGIEAIPGEKLFFLQLADAPRPAMDVLQWSRHYRCFPGQGGFDVTGFVRHVLAAGYTGPLSLEVFNDVFRQTDARRTARDAMRSLIALEESLRPSGAVPVAPSGFAFAELATGGSPEPARLLSALGFSRTGRHRTKPVELWEQGGARILLNATSSPTGVPGAAGPSEGVTDAPRLAAIGLETPDPAAAVKRAETLLAPVLPRERAPGDAPLDAIAAPDGTALFFCRTGRPDHPDWTADFPRESPVQEEAPRDGGVTGIDHVALTQPWQHFDEAALFHRGVLGLRPQESLEVADPYGLLRSRAMAGGGTRLVVNMAAVGGPRPPSQHVALAVRDLRALARRLRAEHPELLLPVPANYHDNLEARYATDPAIRELGLLYDRDERGEFLQLYTVTAGRVFLELVERIGGYDGYGAANAYVRLAVQRAERS